MNVLASVLIVLLAWTLLAWVCGMAVGGMINLMAGRDEFDDPWMAAAGLNRRLWEQ